MQPGDVLARGAKRASFDVTDKQMSETEFDFRTLGKQEFMEKYGLDGANYDALISLSLLSKPLPVLQPKFTKAETVTEIPDHVDNLSTILPPKPAFRYEGAPFNDLVLVERIERESNSLVIVPDSFKGKSDMGVIAAVGDGTRADGTLRPIKVSVGELVLFDKYAAQGADICLSDKDGNEKTYLMLREYDILLKLTKVTND